MLVVSTLPPPVGPTRKGARDNDERSDDSGSDQHGASSCFYDKHEEEAWVEELADLFESLEECKAMKGPQLQSQWPAEALREDAANKRIISRPTAGLAAEITSVASKH
ncbi:hypothetical protein HPB52_019910 [Rhipicephalus sanguineus]|uniref:Uncharacterized protein n=1 Tax=Rhipicephalus sanguineus TaxID=34632 RepID=A0A9D4PEY5_RHISA|nr:hypothetical protein HPB52_019910 [Rhipicephalus sanguineus]